MSAIRSVSGIVAARALFSDSFHGSARSVDRRQRTQGVTQSLRAGSTSRRILSNWAWSDSVDVFTNASMHVTIACWTLVVRSFLVNERDGCGACAKPRSERFCTESTPSSVARRLDKRCRTELAECRNRIAEPFPIVLGIHAEHVIIEASGLQPTLTAHSSRRLSSGSVGTCRSQRGRDVRAYSKASET